MTGSPARPRPLALALALATSCPGVALAKSGDEPPSAEGLEAGALARLGAKAGSPHVTSAALTRAAREIARRAATGDPRPLGAEAVRRALSDAGAFDPAPSTLLVVAPPAQVGESLARAAQLGEATHVGIGVELRGSKAWAVLIAAERHAEIDPLPRSVAAGSRATLRGALLALSRPRVFVSTPSGWAREVPTHVSGGRFEAPLEFVRPGRYRIEVMGEGRYGPTVAAVFDVSCGTTPPTDGDTGEPDPADDAAAEAAVLRAIDVLRGRQGLAPLRRDPRLTDLARRHSAAMRSAAQVAHILPGGGDVVRRLDAAQVPFSRAWENVARGDGALDAHQAVVGSPAHLANLLAPLAEGAGVGIARDQRPGGQKIAYLTEILIAGPDEDASSALTPEGRVKEAIASERARLGLAPLEPDVRLDELAREVARGMLRRGDPAPGDLVARVLALEAGGRDGAATRTATADCFVVSSPAQAAQSKNTADIRFRRFGVGAVRGDSPRFGAGRYWIAVVYLE